MADILVVHDDPSPDANDTNLVNWLTGLGHTVSTASEANALPDVGYDVVIITESGSSGSTAIGSIPTCDLPVMMFETTWNTALMSSAAASTNGSGTQYDLSSHAVNTGYDDPLTVNVSSQSFYGVATSTLPSGVEVLATAAGIATHATAIFAESGATLTSGTAPNRRCCMGLVSSRLSNMITAAPDWFEDVILLTAGTAGGGGGQSVAVGLVSETDAAQPVSSSFAQSVGMVATTDESEPVGRNKAYLIRRARRP